MANDTYLKWSELRGKPVRIPSEGKVAGIIEDFYFETGTQSVDSFLVRTRVEGDFAVPVNHVLTISTSGVNISSAQMMTRSLPPLSLGSQLTGTRLQNDKGNDIGTVQEIWLGIDPPSTSRIVAFEVTERSKRTKRVTIDSIESFEDGAITIF